MATDDLLFIDDARLHDGGFFAVWRRGDVVGVRIVGPLDDERNPVWRAWLDDRFARDGMPRFLALDVKSATPAASLPKRMQTAAWGRRLLGQISLGTIHLGHKANVSLAVKAILRVSGMDNVWLRTDDDAFAADIDAMLRGRVDGRD